jgi:hypothetical protein
VRPGSCQPRDLATWLPRRPVRHAPGAALDDTARLGAAVLAKVDGRPHPVQVRTPRTPQRTVLLALAAVLVLGGCTGVVSGTGRSQPVAARQQLEELAVTSAHSMRGYSRSRFPHWRTQDGCTTREAVLRRDGLNVLLGKECAVLSGRWLSPYEDRWVDSPSMVDIDHIVPLANAWRSGADEWTDERRGDFANDLARPELLAVTVASNRAKGDQDPSLWRPPNRSYWCAYAQSWVAVKHYWKLSVTYGEKTALLDMLETCRWQSSAPPTSSPAPAA